ncbi:hypothetical protein K0M31_011450, partial [Melipona bicolor]
TKERDAGLQKPRSTFQNPDSARGFDNKYAKRRSIDAVNKNGGFACCDQRGTTEEEEEEEEEEDEEDEEEARNKRMKERTEKRAYEERKKRKEKRTKRKKRPGNGARPACSGNLLI